MRVEVKHIVLLAFSFLLLFAIAEIIFRATKCKAEYTRKLVHIVTGLLTMLFPVLLNSVYSVAFLCGSFLLILLISKHMGWLPSINAIDRRSYGSIAYPIVVFLVFCIYANFPSHVQQQSMITYYHLPLLFLALCDPAAALVGKRFPLKPITVGGEKKSVGGSLAFFIVAIAIGIVAMNRTPDVASLTRLLLAAAVVTLTELYSRRGWDNLTIPFATIATFHLLELFI